MDIEKMAENMYNAYGDEAKWVNYAGLPMPPWVNLSTSVQHYWAVAANKALEEVKEQAFQNISRNDFIEIQQETTEIRDATYDLAACIRQKMIPSQEEGPLLSERYKRGGDRLFDIIVSKSYIPSLNSSEGETSQVAEAVKEN